MAQPHVWSENSGLDNVDEIMTTLHKIAQAGLISDKYLVDFVEVATRMRKYIKPATPAQPNKRYSARTRGEFIQAKGLMDEYFKFCESKYVR